LERRVGQRMLEPPMTDTPRDADSSVDDGAPDPGHLDRPLDQPDDGARRRAAQVGAALWLAFHVLVPLRYYVLPGHDPYDERFAWRMFSAVRVQRCEVTVEETILDTPRPVRLVTWLPMPWIALVERNRPAVQRGLLSFRCDAETRPRRVEVRSRCVEASGERARPIRRAIDCETRVITEDLLEEATP
jgi:hypothetical protein